MGSAESDTLTCSACGFENRAGSLFCGGCGASLAPPTTCPACQAENPHGQAFCNACGAALATAEEPAGPAPPALPDHLARKAGAQAGERKQVTVLFADVLGSMDLAERTDPERWQEIMSGFFGVLAGAVHRFEGTVDKFTGDGIMALFGAPIAHEDHAARACYAALEMQNAVSEYAGELRRREGISLAARIGINSGQVVVGSIGEGGSMEYTAVGHTVGLAQRMESLAEPGKAYLTDSTAKLAAGYLELRDLGDFEIKGSSEPVRVHELAGIGSARGRLDVSRARGFARFVGRAQEMDELEAALKRAEGGEGSVIGIVAEAGIGKSRLCHEFGAHCRQRGVEVYEAQCQAHGKSLPLLPVLQMMRAYFGIEPDNSERVARERIAGRLLLLDPEFEEDLGLVFDFLAVPDPDRPAPQMNPEARQRRLLGLVTRLVRAQGREGAAVNLLEDLHWIDPASELFLTALIDAIPGTGSVVVTNFRPEYRAEWMRRSYYSQLALAPLGPEALGELLAELLGDDPSLDGLAELVRERTGGNPFYVEESVRDLAESGALAGERGGYRLVRQIDDVAVPATVQAVLAARIDRLTDRAKAVLQAAATIGKEFTVELLALASDLAPDELEEPLRELIDGEFVYETQLYPERECAFRHPLTREVAYESQLGSARARTHAAIAIGLQRVDADRLDERAALIAQHFEEAGEAMEAVRWHARAAGWAGFNDPRAAAEHWRRVRALDPELPATEEADQARTVARLMILAVGWRVGTDLAEARQVFAECRELAERRGDHATLTLIHGALGIAEGTSGGDVGEYVRLVEEGTKFVAAIEEPNGRVAAATMPYYALYCAGRHADALASLDRVLELTAEDHMLGGGVSVGNPHAWATSFRATVLMALGRCAEARRAIEEGTRLCRLHDQESLGWTHGFCVNLASQGADRPGPQTLAHARQAVEIADTLGDGFSRVLAYGWLGAAHLLTGDPRQALPVLDLALAQVAERRVGLEWEPWVRAYRARALAALGDVTAAAEEGELAVRLVDERQVTIWAPHARIELAEVLLANGSPDDLARAEAVLSEAEALAEQTSQLLEIATALRVRALLHDRHGDTEARDRDRSRAYEIARDTGAEGILAQLEADELGAPAGAA